MSTTGFSDKTAHSGAAGEAEFLKIPFINPFDHFFSGAVFSKTVKNVQNPGRKACFLKKFGKQVSNGGSVFRGLPNHCVPAENCRNNFPTGYSNGEIPGSDHAGHPIGSPVSHAFFVAHFRPKSLTVQTPSFALKKMSCIDGFLYASQRFPTGFSNFSGDHPGEHLFIFGEEFAKAADDFATGGGGGLTPAFKSLAGRFDGFREFFGASYRKNADNVVIVRGVERFERLT